MTTTERALYRSIQKSKDWNETKRVVKNFPNIHSLKDADGKSVLHVASETGNLPLVQLLLSNRRVCFTHFLRKYNLNQKFIKNR